MWTGNSESIQLAQVPSLTCKNVQGHVVIPGSGLSYIQMVLSSTDCFESRQE